MGDNVTVYCLDPPFGNANINECNEKLPGHERNEPLPPFGNANINECNSVAMGGSLSWCIRHSVMPTSTSATVTAEPVVPEFFHRHSVMPTSTSATASYEVAGVKFLPPPFGNANINECNSRPDANLFTSIFRHSVMPTSTSATARYAKAYNPMHEAFNNEHYNKRLL